MALVMLLEPLYLRTAAIAVAVSVTPFDVLFAQTITPPDGAADGEALGRSLLRAPSTSADGSTTYYNGSSGVESITTGELFQSRGSQDDVQRMMDAFGDESAATATGSDVALRMQSETSEQANAVRTVRDGALMRSHPDLGTDPALTRSFELLRGEDPVFDTFFGDCSEQTTDTTPRVIHVEDFKYCSRVVLPENTCEIVHDYQTGLVQVTGGDGGLSSCGPGCMDVFVGRVGDNYWDTHDGCQIFEQDVGFLVDNAAAITSATLEQVVYDDRMRIYLAGNLVWQGPDSLFPPETSGRCDFKRNNDDALSVDLTSYFQTNGALNFRIRVSVGDGGEGYARIRLRYDPTRLATRDLWTVAPECQPLITAVNDGACTNEDIRCLDGPDISQQCLTIDGLEVCQDALSPSPVQGLSSLCRRGQVTATCAFFEGPLSCWTDPNGVEHCPSNDGGNPNGCAPFETDPHCAYISNECIEGAQGASGACYAFNEKWDCGYGVEVPTGHNTTVTCDGPIRCMGDECITNTPETNPDFSKAAGMLSATEFMAMDMNCVANNPDTCTVFTGEPMECKKALGGYQDCCNQPVSVNLADYLKFTMANYKLAKQLGLIEKLSGLGMQTPGAWAAIRNFASETWQTITKPFTSAFGSLVQSWSDTAVDQIENITLEELKKQMTKEIAQFVADHFGAEVAGVFFDGTVDTVTGQFSPTGELSGQFASALNVIMWVYTVYVILDLLIQIIWQCEEEEFTLAARRELKQCNYIGHYCKTDSPFGCIEVRDVYCCYNSPLARIVMESAMDQFGLMEGEDPEDASCPGLTLAQVASLDWSRVDLDQWYALLASNGIIPNDTATFDSDYAIDNVTRNEYADFDAPSAPERIDHEVEGAEHFDEAREKVREDLWSGIGGP